MASRADPAVVTFASGVLSPKLLGREDIKQYAQGLRHGLNFVVMPHGGLTRRPGTYFVAEVKDSADAGRLIPFQYSTEQTYMIEAGDLYFRFYANSGRLEDPPGTPVELVTPWSSADLPDLQWAQTADTMYLVHPNYLPRKLTRTSATTFSLTTVSFSLSRAPILALNQNPDNYATITGAWPNLTVTMVNDTFVAGDVGRTFYVRSTVDKNAYYMTIAGFTSAKIVTATGISRFSASAGAPTGTDADRWAFGAMDATHGCNAVAFHEGRLFYGGFALAPDMIWGSVSDDFDNFELTSPDSATTDAENDDQAIQRRCISSQVNTVRWLASGGDQLLIGTSGAEFRLKPANDDILSPLTASLKRAAQRGAAPLAPVIIDNNIYYIDRSNAILRQLRFDLVQDGLVSTDISIIAEHLLLPGVWEMAYQQSPLSVVWQVLIDGTLVAWSIEKDQEVAAAHPHAIGGSVLGVSSNAFVESIGVVPGANTSLGTLEDQVWLLVRRTIDGATKRYVEYMKPYYRPNLSLNTSALTRSAALESAFFMDCGLSLNSPITVSGISAAASATVTATSHGLSNGDTVRFRGVGIVPGADMNAVFEQKRFTVSSAAANTFVPLDAITGLAVDTTGLTFASASVYKEVSSVSGLSHLEGEEVAVLTDGKLHPNRTVASGAITLDLPASIIHVGLPFTSQAETMPIAAGGPRGSQQGYPQQFGQVAVRLFDTLGGEYGRGDNPRHFEPLIFENAGDLMDYSPPLFSGDRKLVFPGSARDDLPTINFRQTQALPMTLLGLYPRTWSNVD